MFNLEPKWFSYRKTSGEFGRRYNYKNYEICTLKREIGPFQIGSKMDRIRVDFYNAELSFLKRNDDEQNSDNGQDSDSSPDSNEETNGETKTETYTIIYTTKLELILTETRIKLETGNKVLEDKIKELEDQINELKNQINGLKKQEKQEDYYKSMMDLIVNKYK